ncbi:MAG TPA: 50S ribosomal protein L4 [Candidatus Omnitrophota bacterium]|nr:50S ribosomal protein L4 [Candidatus Omnitrophota bacterium]
MAKLAIFNREGKEKGSIEIPDEIFTAPVNTDVIHQAMVAYQACQRQGTADCKTRKDVSGGGIKPWRQKGTGRARHGSIRSPLWRGGGVTFGPIPRDFSFTVPKRVKWAALRESLNAKFQANNWMCVDDIKEPLTKTKEFASILNALKLKGSVLALLDGCDTSIERVSRNVGSFRLVRAQDVNAYDILCSKNVLASKTAVGHLLERIK